MKALRRWLTHNESCFRRAASIFTYGARGKYNYGYEVVPDSGGRINSTVLYSAANCTTSCPYAVITAFAKDPALPGMFGVQVNSNSHVATISLFSALYGDGPTTETDIFLFVEAAA